jgi:hypothetical protein
VGEQPRTSNRATLTIAGENIGLNRFVEGALVGIIEGFLSALRDTGPGEVVITIPAGRRGPDGAD